MKSKNENKKLFAVVDIETSGYYNTCNNITEIAVLLFDGNEVIKEFHSLVNPKTSINPYVVRLTGITNQMVAHAPTFPEIAKQVWEITKDAVFVAHAVNFDYQYIKNEFKSFGVDFKRQKLCTVKLARKCFPKLPSYSLGNICKDLNIEIENRHRAMGDATATVKLLQLCLSKEERIENEAMLKELMKESVLPPKLHQDIFTALPDKTGVYYFYNEEGKIIYIGKANNIKKRIYSHFVKKDIKKEGFYNSVANISYTITGSEIIALLLESDEIKKHYPLYNRKQKRDKRGWELIQFTNRSGTLQLALTRASAGNDGILNVSNLTEGKNLLEKLIETYELCPKYCGLQAGTTSCFNYQLKKCKGVCAGIENIESYNERVQTAMENLHLNIGDLLIKDQGRNEKETSIVVIKNGIYRGFGYAPKTVELKTVAEATTYIKHYEHNSDVQKIIRSWVKKCNTH